MSTVHAQIEIAATPQQVFDTVMDPTRLREWVTIHRDVKVHGDGALAPGARMDQSLQILGVPFRVHWTLTAIDPPNSAEWQGRGPAGSRALIRYLVRGADGGPTQFAYTNEFSTPGGPLGNVASRLVVGHASEREAQLSLAKLKKLLETP